MTNAEVNKIIAEYMGCTLVVSDDGLAYIEDALTAEHHLYTHSLDALIPVWEKINASCDLSVGNKVSTVRVLSSYQCQQELNRSTQMKSTIQEAAAHCTAKAILQPKENNND